MRIIAISFFVLLSGCSLFGNEQNVSDGINGDWEWYLTSGGWTHISADTARYDMTLEIYNQDRVDWFRNDTLVQKYVIKEDSAKGELVMYHLNGEPGHGDCDFIIDHHPEVNELHLPTRCNDFPTYYFKRK